MTARLAKIVSSLAAVALTTACGGYSEISIETPIRPTMDVSAFQRVFVAGFISGGSEDVDGNLETTRLLRSQLRTKSELRVIDSDVLPLMDVASENRTSDGGAPVAEDGRLPGCALVSIRPTTTASVRAGSPTHSRAGTPSRTGCG